MLHQIVNQYIGSSPLPRVMANQNSNQATCQNKMAIGARSIYL